MVEKFLTYPVAFGPPLTGASGKQLREGLDDIQTIDTHIQNLIVSALLTHPGERVMQPKFGAGLDRSVFENISPLAATALEYRIRESLTNELSHEIILEDLIITPSPDEGAIRILIDYVKRLDRIPHRLEIVI